MHPVFVTGGTGYVEGDFVVFLIGMRINKPWKIHKWLPVALAMPRMLKELEGNRESGYLGNITGLGVIVQYWRSIHGCSRRSVVRDELCAERRYRLTHHGDPQLETETLRRV